MTSKPMGMQSKDLIREILEASQESDADEAEYNEDDSDFSDHLSIASDEDDVMTVDDEPFVAVARRQSIDEAPPPSRLITNGINNENIDFPPNQQVPNSYQYEFIDNSETTLQFGNNTQATSCFRSASNEEFRLRVRRRLNMDGPNYQQNIQKDSNVDQPTNVPRVSTSTNQQPSARGTTSTQSGNTNSNQQPSARGTTSAQTRTTNSNQQPSARGTTSTQSGNTNSNQQPSARGATSAQTRTTNSNQQPSARGTTSAHTHTTNSNQQPSARGTTSAHTRTTNSNQQPSARGTTSAQTRTANSNMQSSARGTILNADVGTSQTDMNNQLTAGDSTSTSSNVAHERGATRNQRPPTSVQNTTSLSNGEIYDNSSDNEQSCNYISKDNTIWSKKPPTQGRARLENIRRDNGPRVNIPRNTVFDLPVHAFMLFLNPILNLIVEYTNLRAAMVHDELNYTKEWVKCDITEIKAFVGICIMVGAVKQSKMCLDKLWSHMHGSAFVRATMSRNRFRQLMRFIRFDDYLVRDRNDKFAPMREVWEKVNALFGKYYTPGDNLTIDEQLLPFRGKCGFRQYMPSKPDKYGIKFWHAVDSETYYPVNCMPYLGRDRNGERNVGLGKNVVLTLSEPYYGSGRNITCDNYFTSLELANILLEKKLTLLGTVKKNKTFLPEDFKPHRNRPEQSSVFGFTYNITIVSYVPAKNKAVALLSTLHHDNKIDVTKKNKPEIILDYNATKGGVDTLDQMAHTYTSKRRTCRWPLAVFFNLLDLIGIASYVIWRKNNPGWNDKKSDKRFRFLDAVSMSLVHDQIQRRYEGIKHKATRDAMDKVMDAGGIPKVNKDNADEAVNELQQEQPAVTRKRRCHVCPRKQDRKSWHVCDVCKEPICKEHAKIKRTCHKC